MAVNYSGFQFNNVSDDNIDPALLANDSNDSQTFDRDVEMATGDGTGEQQNDPTIAFPTTQITPSRPLNPQAVVYEPLAQQSSSSSPPQFENFVNYNEQSHLETHQWLGTFPIRPSPPQNQTPPTINLGWQENNPWSPLSPDWTGYLQPQQGSAERWPHAPYPPQTNQYPTPPNSGNHYGYRGHVPWLEQDFCPIPSQPVFPPVTTATESEHGAGLSLDNVSTLPTDKQQSEHVNEWNEQSYQAGDRTRRRSLAPPPTPAHSNRGRPRGSTTSSVSGLTCETCGSAFNKKHELDHHRRCHGPRAHVCTICNKRFVYHKDLVRHMATHSKAQRHIFCNIIGCKYHDKGFGRMDHLKRHNDKKHPGNLLTPTTSSHAGG